MNEMSNREGWNMILWPFKDEEKIKKYPQRKVGQNRKSRLEYLVYMAEILEIIKKSSILTIWIIAGIIIVPSTLIAYLFWDKWTKWLSNL